jgi:hypothetical protein
VSGINIDEIQERPKLTLNSLNQWFKSNGLSLNLRKTKVLKFDIINHDSVPVHLKFNDELLQEEIHITFLGIEIDKFLNWKKYETI